MNRLQRLWFRVKTGSRIEVANGGKSVEEIVIRYKGYFFMIFLDSESGEPTGDFGWSEGVPMSPVPVREIYVAKRGKE